MFIKIIATFLTVGLSLLAIAEATDNHTLIVISVIALSGTLLTSIITGVFTVIGLKISANNSIRITEQTNKVEEIRKNTDGMLHKLEASQLQTSEAKQEVARAEGVQQERVEQRERISEIVTTIPPQVEIINPKTNPVNTTPVRKTEEKKP